MLHYFAIVEVKKYGIARQFPIPVHGDDEKLMEAVLNHESMDDIKAENIEMVVLIANGEGGPQWVKTLYPPETLWQPPSS